MTDRRPAPTDEPPLTELLQRSARGDASARERAWTRIHAQLRAMARNRLAHEARLTCQPTELVHEAFLKLNGQTPEPRDRHHFLALAAVAMRQVLVDQARSRLRHKRGGGVAALTLDSRVVGGDHAAAGIDLLELHDAIDALAKVDPRKAHAVVLSYFGGLTDPEVAEVLEIAPATVKRDLRTARAWLASALEPGDAAGDGR
ncbi:MAG: sigma-70 family RNA polymerase sigma factor [Wenzhouxiangellaceae bacterium]